MSWWDDVYHNCENMLTCVWFLLCYFIFKLIIGMGFIILHINMYVNWSHCWNIIINYWCLWLYLWYIKFEFICKIAMPTLSVQWSVTMQCLCLIIKNPTKIEFIGFIVYIIVYFILLQYTFLLKNRRNRYFVHHFSG